MRVSCVHVLVFSSYSQESRHTQAHTCHTPSPQCAAGENWGRFRQKNHSNPFGTFMGQLNEMIHLFFFNFLYTPPTPDSEKHTLSSTSNLTFFPTYLRHNNNNAKLTSTQHPCHCNCYMRMDSEAHQVPLSPHQWTRWCTVHLCERVDITQRSESRQVDMQQSLLG